MISNEPLPFDVCVVGGGSGGFGAACAAARHGARVLLVEASGWLGGTSTAAGVNNWEPVAGPTGLPSELFERLRRLPDAVSIQLRGGRRRVPGEPPPSTHRPWGSDPTLLQQDRRSGATDYRLSLSRLSGASITFEPELLDRVMAEALAEQPTCIVWRNSRFVEAHAEDGVVRAVRVERPDSSVWVSAKVFIDASADVYLARAVGCLTRIGPETKDVYGEPSAPDEPVRLLNNASLCYRVARIAPGDPRQEQPLPKGVKLDLIRPVTSIRSYPNGDLNLNPLHMMTGWEAHELGREAAYAEAHRRMLAHWHLMQTQFGFGDWKLTWVSPSLGVRESHRVVARYVLREQDVQAGLAAQESDGTDDVVAIADHSMDFHGARRSSEMPNGPYGVPFRCLLPREVDNLLVACRGAGFSSIAASSCRLSRTMMTLGEAAGTAAALFGPNVARYDAVVLRRDLEEHGVALTLERGYLDAMSDVEPLAPAS